MRKLPAPKSWMQYAFLLLFAGCVAGKEVTTTAPRPVNLDSLERVAALPAYLVPAPAGATAPQQQAWLAAQTRALGNVGAVPERVQVKTKIVDNSKVKTKEKDQSKVKTRAKDQSDHRNQAGKKAKHKEGQKPNQSTNNGITGQQLAIGGVVIVVVFLVLGFFYLRRRKSS
ncbi:hypothetical protein HER32_06645 [Hymenobacter sp. BT18]|uniref:hypothetical protein n=1 Tax=Hymenobacter sp. BT18 TaxID=2835648 RepID=UPI00143E1489|nr:hypothetical protein [Hymenobacter sp. BT18]QIX60871.1 hypothetical protein HER32_06645 [Hymenobacter sp. BT18]